MALGDDEGAVALALAHFFHRFTGLVAIDDVLEGVLLDVAQFPLFTAAVAGCHVAPRVNEEEVAQCAAGRTVLVSVTTQTAVDRAIEVGTAVVLQAVFQAATLAGEQCFDEQFVLAQGLLALNLVIILVEVPGVVHRTVAQFHIQGHAQVVEVQQVHVVVRRNDHREADVFALGLLQFQHGAQGMVKAVLDAARQYRGGRCQWILS